MFLVKIFATKWNDNRNRKFCKNIAFVFRKLSISVLRFNLLIKTLFNQFLKLKYARFCMSFDKFSNIKFCYRKIKEKIDRNIFATVKQSKCESQSKEIKFKKKKSSPWRQKAVQYLLKKISLVVNQSFLFLLLTLLWKPEIIVDYAGRTILWIVVG